MMRQCGVGNSEFFLDLTHCHSGLSSPNQFTHNFESSLVSKLTQKLSRCIVTQFHEKTISKHVPAVN